ncbi:hypothetical protein [Arthrobacter sp. EpRS71]|uniref:hypothetical protein n=1 Tax=Arthrobacter sp. EpRS71 TaxID=1743141 RepID=UPI00074B07E1|nr:hypothetical protein [Arthrobacter sp. EpRS71]KUM40645.1 hypothetical protein AR689_04560 [Arthrobacter sp. EpRS71]
MNRPDPNSADQSANKDDDAVWLDLVSRLEATQSGPAGELPDDSLEGNVSEAEQLQPGRGRSFKDFDPLGLSTPAQEPESDAATASADPEAAGRPSGPRDFEVEDEDQTFIPEDPPSLAGTEPLVMLAWFGAVGGPIALLFTAMLWRSAPLTATLGIVAVFVASVVYLIMRLPQEKNEDDDGARL